VDLIYLLRRVILHLHQYSCRKKAIRGVLLITLLCMITVNQFGQSAGIIVHDPVAVKQDKTFYLFSTGTGIACFSSPDLSDWHYAGSVFDTIPAWAYKLVPDFDGHIWAPDISYHLGKYFLYYSISSFAKNISCIGLAVNKTLDRKDPQYHWSDEGVVIQSIPGRDQWNAIDPNLITDTSGVPWLVFGSFWEGIKLVRLNNNFNSPAEPQEWFTLARRKRDFEIPDKKPGNGAIEAPFIYRSKGYYYLFVSFDFCCRGVKSDYKIAVGRSQDITGPYFDKEGTDMYFGGGTVICEGNDAWPGLGHNAVYKFDEIDYMLFHAYDASDEGRPKLIIEKITWDSEGWPSVVLTD
jgi:arabinan endo-1,5-alpha-L-arabinosidase